LVDRDAIAERLAEAAGGIAYGMGRSYGDVCVSPGGPLWMTAGLDRFIGFDAETGRLRCEPGVLLGQIQRWGVRHGWMLPVTPGTQMATVGGAVANDVHGKNHHVRGSFGTHVLWLRLARGDGSTIECGPALRPDWFAATVGGLGLTGVIAEVELQLMPVPGPWLETETVPFDDLDAFFELSGVSERDWEYTVAWIDCVAGAGVRGLFIRGRHIPLDVPEPAPRRFEMPFVPPVSLVNRFSLRAFNEIYYRLGAARAGRRVIHYDSFFYPLDNIAHWNRMYGPRGFFQYQSVVPRGPARDAVRQMLEAIARSGEGSFLAVLKTFGDVPNVGMLSFPMPGATLALDFPNRGAATHALFGRLDAIVAEAGGRLYPAKDARMPRSLFESGHPRLGEFLNYRDPSLASAMSRRLIGS
jgi:FAD/FMN-containing dehydrogenase